ncbi:MAG: triose-phosphate isomerase [Desulfurococcaceae archaeon]
MGRKLVLAVNYKAYYPHSLGENAVRIARAAAKLSQELPDVELIVAPPATELRKVVEVVSGTDVKVFGQHADPLEPGAITGYLPLEALKEAGAHGVILNHSEHRLKLSDIYTLIRKAGALGLRTLVCADVPETGAAVATLGPTMVAVEPPELIGTGISVSRAKPEVITRSVELIRTINRDVVILTGAGISDGEDAYRAVKLGTSGVLVASAVVKSSDPYVIMRELAEGMLRALRE